MQKPNPLITLFFALLGIFTWNMAVAEWFHHDDHNSLAWFAASICLSHVVSSRVMRYRGIL